MSDHAWFTIILKLHRPMSILSPNIALSKATVTYIVLKHDSDCPCNIINCATTASERYMKSNCNTFCNNDRGQPQEICRIMFASSFSDWLVWTSHNYGGQLWSAFQVGYLCWNLSWQVATVNDISSLLLNQSMAITAGNQIRNIFLCSKVLQIPLMSFCDIRGNKKNI